MQKRAEEKDLQLSLSKKFVLAVELMCKFLGDQNVRQK